MSIPVWLQELKDVEAKATPRPWESSLDTFNVNSMDPRAEGPPLGKTCGKPGQRWDDARLIAMGRNQLPRFIEITEGLDREREAEKAWRDHEGACAVCAKSGTCDEGTGLRRVSAMCRAVTDDALYGERDGD